MIPTFQKVINVFFVFVFAYLIISMKAQFCYTCHIIMEKIALKKCLRWQTRVRSFLLYFAFFSVRLWDWKGNITVGTKKWLWHSVYLFDSDFTFVETYTCIDTKVQRGCKHQTCAAIPNQTNKQPKHNSVETILEKRKHPKKRGAWMQLLAANW